MTEFVFTTESGYQNTIDRLIDNIKELNLPNLGSNWWKIFNYLPEFNSYLY